MKKKTIISALVIAMLSASLSGCSCAKPVTPVIVTPTEAVKATETPVPTKAVQATETPTLAPAATSTPEPTVTKAPTNTPVPTATSTPVPTATSTPTPEPTATSTPTPEPTATSTPVPTATPTPEPTATNTPTPTSTPTPTATNTPTNTPKPTNTPTNTPTPTAKVTPIVVSTTEDLQEIRRNSSNPSEQKTVFVTSTTFSTTPYYEPQSISQDKIDALIAFAKTVNGPEDIIDMLWEIGAIPNDEIYDDASYWTGIRSVYPKDFLIKAWPGDPSNPINAGFNYVKSIGFASQEHDYHFLYWGYDDETYTNGRYYFYREMF